jgi:serine-type D-Ala-D-Ala carboxypeptidase (penicillin-binding protein 5/6)
MKRIILFVLLFLLAGQPLWAAGRAEIASLTKDPYLSALLIDADSGEVLFADNPDAQIFPASIVKLITLLVVLEQVEQGRLALSEMVQITDEAARMGGSQVYLDPREQFSVEELLYALIVQSANDAAIALAGHVAGSREAFVELMNRTTAELGMSNTRLYSPHGLPPATGQQPDVTTAHDLAILSRALVRRPEVLRYTSTVERSFRDDNFIMRTHNHLLRQMEGCDGLKTGYFKAAGFSITATAKRGGARVIAIVAGSADRKVRDAKAMELLARGFTLLPAKPENAATPALPPGATGSPSPGPTAAPAPSASEPVGQESPPATLPAGTSGSSSSWWTFFLGVATTLVVVALVAFWIARRRSRKGRGRYTGRY